MDIYRIFSFNQPAVGYNTGVHKSPGPSGGGAEMFWKPNEQIWGIPEIEKKVDKKDYFETEEEIDQRHSPAAGPGDEADS